MYIVKYDLNTDEYVTHGIEEKRETWQEAIDLRNELKCNPYVENIGIYDEEY